MIDFSNNYLCTGCSACVVACPVKCITMKENEEGFLYPSLTGKCISCGKCETVCPILDHKKGTDKNFEKYAFAACSKNKRNYKKSSSGGLFVEICKSYGDEETIVFGAVFENLKVFHKYVIGVSNAQVFSKSKYISSDLKNVFFEVKTFLLNSKKVIFSGTPCQIAGLKSYLGVEYNKLLTIDFVCHGVGSPDVFHNCLEVNNYEFGNRCKEYGFRSKIPFYRENYISQYKYNNKLRYKLKDRYNQLYLNQLCLRNSCGSNCKFRTLSRESDITLADFKNFQKVFKKTNAIQKKYSTVVVNTEKANEFCVEMKKYVDSYTCNIEDISNYNPLLMRSTDYDPKARNNFFASYKLDKTTAILNNTKYKHEYSFVVLFVSNIIKRGIKFLNFRRVNSNDN